MSKSLSLDLRPRTLAAHTEHKLDRAAMGWQVEQAASMDAVDPLRVHPGSF